MSDSVRPHRWQPTRLPRPWDSPGKNTGVGCHFLLQCMKVESESEVAQSCLTLGDPMDCSPPGSSVHGILQAKTLEQAAISSSRNLRNPGIEPGCPALAGGFFIAEPLGKPRCACIYTCVTESLCCPPETQHRKSTALQDELKHF